MIYVALACLASLCAANKDAACNLDPHCRQIAMIYVALACLASLCAANKYAACNLDPHCRQIANLSAVHTSVMAMVTEDRIECKLAGLCPNRKPSHSAARVQCLG